ncbi:transporter [Flavobacterium album]|uniref:Transporter n=2 Tax=Flavobacterium album TaxID=2175091 RepID=A0A2S1R325_9FLAO|nr:TolC family protein [Flavobacterium album]AWH87055.1 transporter [Flavobacterium album]
MRLIYITIFMFAISASAQVVGQEQMTFSEYIGYVKKFHPVVRQANLQVSAAQAALMAARGAFDPKLEVDYNAKEFKGTEYYSLLNSSFKIPTWYGIELKAAFDNSEGMYLNPQNVTPNSGLTSVGISIPLGKGLLINSRMADVRAAKINLNLGDAERKLQTANALHDASLAYFKWQQAHQEVALYQTYLDFASQRYEGITKLIEAGDKAAIDSVEAGIIVRNRMLTLEDARLKLAKARLEMSNYLWIDNVPVELSETIVPQDDTKSSVWEAWGITNSDAIYQLPENHPKIVALESKRDVLDIERKLKANLLLPEINLSYNYLSEPAYFDNYRLEDYKIGLNFSFPLFLRKERGGLKLAKLKLQDAQLDLDLERVALKNKIMAQEAEIRSVERQQELLDSLVKNYSQMLLAEEGLFAAGESSIFLINSRENSLVGAKLSQINMENRYLTSTVKLFNILGLAQ